MGEDRGEVRMDGQVRTAGQVRTDGQVGSSGYSSMTSGRAVLKARLRRISNLGSRWKTANISAYRRNCGWLAA